MKPIYHHLCVSIAILSVGYAIGFIFGSHFGFSTGQKASGILKIAYARPVPVLTVMPLDWSRHTILYPYIYCYGGYDSPHLHDWGLRCTVNLENEDGVMTSSTEWLSPEAISDALDFPSPPR